MKFRKPVDIDFNAIKADYEMTEEEKKANEDLFGDNTPFTPDFSDAGYNPETGVTVHYCIDNTKYLSDEEYAEKMNDLNDRTAGAAFRRFLTHIP